jgi:hypothetical protein
MIIISLDFGFYGKNKSGLIQADSLVVNTYVHMYIFIVCKSKCGKNVSYVLKLYIMTFKPTRVDRPFYCVFKCTNATKIFLCKTEKKSKYIKTHLMICRYCQANSHSGFNNNNFLDGLANNHKLRAPSLVHRSEANV